MDKKAEIINCQKKQNALKIEIKKIKKRLPTYIISFILFASISLYFLEDKFYLFFGNSVNFIIVLIIVFGLLSLFFSLKSYLKIKKLHKEAKEISAKLYNLMKLDLNS